MPDELKAAAEEYADPDCPDCDGQGWATETPNSDPTGGHDEDVFCVCAINNGLDVEAFEPHDRWEP
jgi:hypothetical protein